MFETPSRPPKTGQLADEPQLEPWLRGIRLCASESEAVVAEPAGRSSVATILTRHVLRDGELVLLILRPSRWFILLSSLRFIAAALILMIAAVMLEQRLPFGPLLYVEVGLFAVVSRLMWGVLQWMNRLYLLTNLRIVRLMGVFHVDIFDCPLRKVQRAVLVRPVRERLLRLGSIEIAPQDESSDSAIWQTIRRPVEVHQQVENAIRRAKRTGMMFGG